MKVHASLKTLQIMLIKNQLKVSKDFIRRVMIMKYSKCNIDPTIC